MGRAILFALIAAAASAAVVEIPSRLTFFVLGPAFVLGQVLSLVASGYRTSMLRAVSASGLVVLAWFAIPLTAWAFLLCRIAIDNSTLASLRDLPEPIPGWTLLCRVPVEDESMVWLSISFFGAAAIIGACWNASRRFPFVMLASLLAISVGWGVLAGRAFDVTTWSYVFLWQAPMGVISTIWLRANN